MARQRKSKIFNLFKGSFKISFYHKPCMLEDDICHIIILDDIVRLKIRLVHNTLVVDDITPLTSAYLPVTYDKIIDILIEQKEFNALIAITGNVTVFESACIKVGAPIIEDPRFTGIPVKLYDELKSYYKDDKSKYGFYLLAVNEKEQDTGNNYEKVITPGNIPIPECVESAIKKTFPKSDVKFVGKENWEMGKVYNINGIQFHMSFDTPSKTLTLKNFYLNDMSSFQDLISLCELFEQFGKDASIVLHEVSDPLLYNICDAKGYQNITSNLASPLVSANQRYFQSTYGSYKIDKNNLGGLRT